MHDKGNVLKWCNKYFLIYYPLYSDIVKYVCKKFMML